MLYMCVWCAGKCDVSMVYIRASVGLQLVPFPDTSTVFLHWQLTRSGHETYIQPVLPTAPTNIHADIHTDVYTDTHTHILPPSCVQWHQAQPSANPNWQGWPSEIFQRQDNVSWLRSTFHTLRVVMVPLHLLSTKTLHLFCVYVNIF